MKEMIRPSSDLQYHYAEISNFCKESCQPVIITVNGRADVVIMSLHEYRRMQAELELLRMLADSEADGFADHTASMEDAFLDIRTRLKEKKENRVP